MSKSDKKKQEKIVEDRTFGLKNKNKSKAVQKFCKGVQQTVKNNGKSAALLQSEEYQRKKQRKKEEEQAAILNSLYNQAGNMRKNAEEEEEVDPKSIVCPYFKQGLCQKGKKCIYSHDLALDRTQEIDLYVDQRTQLIMNTIGDKQLNLMSEEELNKIIEEKQKKYNMGTKSEIVCKHFLDAIEKGKYGWNWNCTNGDKCQYKHCLPPGYRLKKDLVKEKVEDIDIEAKIDEQRNILLSKNIASSLVTFQVFQKWKAQKIEKRIIQNQKKKKEEEKKKGVKNMRTGKQLFTYDPTLFIDDQEAADDYEQIQEPEVEEEEEKRLYIHQEDEDDQNQEAENNDKGEEKNQQEGDLQTNGLQQNQTK